MQRISGGQGARRTQATASRKSARLRPAPPGSAARLGNWRPGAMSSAVPWYTASVAAALLVNSNSCAAPARVNGRARRAAWCRVAWAPHPPLPPDLQYPGAWPSLASLARWAAPAHCM
jgi:hypothetical protein